MDRYTKFQNEQYYLIDEGNVKYDAGGFSGAAIKRLGLFEDVYDEAVRNRDQLQAQMDALKNEGKEKTFQFKQLLALKMTNINIINAFQTKDL